MNLKKDINILNLDSNIVDILNKNNIFKIEDLWVLKRINLKEYGLKDSEINNIIIKLELNGLGLNKKSYQK